MVEGGRGNLSLGRDERAKLAEAAFAHAAHDEKMFDFAEGAVAFAVFDDARGERGADAGQAFELCARGAVDVDRRRGVIRRLSGRDFIARGRDAAGQFDARRGAGDEGY